MIRVYTGGTFDLFHYGHMNFLRQCSELGDEVIVALNTDEFIEKYKNQKPILSYAERYESLMGCKYVTRIVKNLSSEDSKPTILSVQPDIIAIGDDWKHKNYYKQMMFTEEWLREHYIELVYLPYTSIISTTILKERIRYGK